MVVAARHDRSVPIASPSTSFSSEDDRRVLRIRLSSISRLEAQKLKQKLTAELEEVRSLINRFDSPINIGSIAKPSPDKGTVHILENCNNLLTKLMNHKNGWVFSSPLDAKALGLIDYHTIVKQPMDLGTVKAKLERSLYKSPLDFAEDVRLTFNNALLYNPVRNVVHLMAKNLLSIFEENWVSIEMEYDNLHRMLRVLPEIARVVEPLPAPPTRALSRPPVPKHRDLTMSEKQRLVEEILDLPDDKAPTVVQIIKKRNPEMSREDDEVELDIECADVETLWELYRFLTMKEEDYESGHNIIQEPVTLATCSETSGVTESGEAIRTSTPVGEENNAGSSCSSNGSSGDSGSSSSDCDSDISLGCSSDNGK